VYGNLLLFSLNAFKDDSGVCGLTGNVTFSDCNLRQYDTATLANCYQLTNLAFMDSHVETLTNIPTLENLKNFTVYSPRLWNGANQRGLSRMTLAPGSSLPQLTYLDLTGNSLKDDSIEFVPQLTTIEELHLEGNNFSVVPNLTSHFNLHAFSMTLNDNATDVSVLLPNPKTPMKSLIVKFYSSSPNTVNNITSLEGKMNIFSNRGENNK
jgi:Leucine-rich repeat (LRR) protein